MSEEDVTKTTGYVRAVEAVSDAAYKLELARVKYDNGVAELLREKREAERALREALGHVMQLTGRPPVPLSEDEKQRREIMQKLDGISKKQSNSDNKH